MQQNQCILSEAAWLTCSALFWSCIMCSVQFNCQICSPPLPLAGSYTCPINLIFIVSPLIALLSIRALSELCGCLYQCRDVWEERIEQRLHEMGLGEQVGALLFSQDDYLLVEILPEHLFWDWWVCRTSAAAGGRGVNKSWRFFWAVEKPCLCLEINILMCSFWMFIPVKCTCSRSCHSP